ncbi:MAG TPA: thiamine phosphate synthase, partial [Gemmataceae bacterium]|nr:thiamine phosphate synthase [Gemmataceae bacterium]
MRAEFTPAVERAIASAKQMAERKGPAPATVAHLFLALIEEEESRAAALLVRAGVSVADARASILEEAVLKSDSPAVPALLAHARELAFETSGERTVGSEHVLLALLQWATAIRIAVEAAGLDMSQIEERFHPPAGSPLRLEEPLNLAAPPEWIDTARIIDANANRCREALRVIEDYCRFALNDAFLSREVKTLRHDLAAHLERFGSVLLTEARDTAHDVGTRISASGEMQRDSLLHVLQVNWKRLQEGLRSLEEYGKCLQTEVATDLEQLRYRAYTLEKATLVGTSARERLNGSRLYALLTASQCAASLEFVIAEAAAGGVDIIQLREKELDDRQLLERARNVRRWTRQAGVLFIVNDRPDIARLAEADGVHLGQLDLPVQEARRILGSNALVGVSTHHI